MRRSAGEVRRLIEQALERWRVPAAQIVNQLAGTQVAPATGSARGTVALSDATPAPIGTAAAGTSSAASRGDHVHAGGVGIPRTVGWYFDGTTFAAGTDQGPNYTIDVDVTLTGAALYAKTAPAGSAAEIDIQRSTDGGTSYSTIFSTRPTIAAGSHTGGGAAVLSTTQLAAGDIVRCDVVSAGGTAAQGVTVLLKMETR